MKTYLAQNLWSLVDNSKIEAAVELNDSNYTGKMETHKIYQCFAYVLRFML